MMLANFHFIRPTWLLLCIPVIVIWWRTRASRDPLNGWRAVMDEELLRAMTLSPAQQNRYRHDFLLAAVLIATLAVAGPTWRLEPSPFADNPVPAMLVLKANESMKQTDLAPSRMERARLKVVDIATARKSLPLGLLCYSGSAHLVLPPTRDTSVVAVMASEVAPEIMPEPGNDLGGALQLAVRTLGQDGGSIVVVADTAQELDVSDVKDLKTRPVSIHFLAVARQETPELDAIQQVAAQLNAKVTLLTPDATDVDELVRSTTARPVAVEAAQRGTRWEEAGWWLVPILAMCSLVSFRRIDRGLQ